jgi:hypothetical protein
MDSARYLDLLDTVVQLPSRLPTEGAATRRSGEVLPDLADRALRRAERRLAQLARAPSEDERRRQQRAARRAVQRASYATELNPRLATEIQRLVEETLDELSAVLSRLEVSSRAQELLRTLGVQANDAGENAFTFGLLHGLESARGDRLVAETKTLRKQLRRLDRV